MEAVHLRRGDGLLSFHAKRAAACGSRLADDRATLGSGERSAW